MRKRRFVSTTDSRHTYAVYPNLTRDGKPTAVNQLWVADITYIRLRESFLYLAVILDAYSRRVIGWALEETLEAQLAVNALQRALAERVIQPSIVHHSDRGVQCCAREYVDLLRKNGFQISMRRTANPYDNALAESCMRTLKCEEVHLHSTIGIVRSHSRTSTTFWSVSIIASGCTRLSAIFHQLRMRIPCTRTARGFQREFSQASEDLSIHFQNPRAERIAQPSV